MNNSVIGHPSAILAIFGYITGNTPASPIISNIRFALFLSKPSPPEFAPSKNGNFFLRVAPRARVEKKKQFRPVGHQSAILALFGYIAGETPTSPITSNIRFPKISQQAESSQIRSWRKQKLFLRVALRVRCLRVFKKSVPASWPSQ